MRPIIIVSIFFFLLPSPLDAIDGSLLFHETFEDINSIEANGGIPKNGQLSFVNGVIGNGGDFSGSRAVCYSLQENFNLNKGTVEFLINAPNANHLGFFDIGSLGSRNSWGIYKNRDHTIMEIKNSSNSYDQAWSPSPIKFDGDWHLISAVWERHGETTDFKVCYDGECKSHYDGIKSDSFPNLDGNFCVGWCGWYGYSESSFDEFKIFDYAKSDAEIIDTYASYFPERVKKRPTITILGAPSVVIGIGTPYSDDGATAYDDEDGDITSNIVKRSDLDITKAGAYRISYDVNDSDGSPARGKIRKVYIVDFNAEPVKRAYEYIAESMDKFHNTFSIYTDFGSGGNHGAPSGWMGYIDILKVDPKWDSYCYNGLTCFKNIWETNAPRWVGIRWLQPENNWGDVPDAGYDLTGATKVTFYGKGEVGGEPVEFLAGGVPGDHPDSIQPAATTGTIHLTKDWQKYTIDLSEKDLSNVISPFGWTVANDPIFYIDDVTYDLPRRDELRFIQSFELVDLDKEIALSNTSYIYDNALALLAFLARGNEEDLRRAKVLADAFVFALKNDRTYSDGRLRNAYMSGDLSDTVPGTAKLPGWWDVTTQTWFEDEFNVSIHTGNMAWAMLALLSFYEMQGGTQYLDAVKTMGEWVERETRDERGNGGYTGGYEGWEQTDSNPIPPQKLLYKATEHSIDLYPVFLRLYYLTNEQKWLERSKHAKQFIESMWNSEAEHFWTGTLDDGVTINKSNIPVDIQAWAVMAIQPEAMYNVGLKWAESNCLLEIDGFEGFDFNDDVDGIWFEGSSQMAVGYQLVGELDKSDKYIAELRKAQTSATNANGKGIVAASHDNVSTGFDWEYFSRLHIGATAWFIFAEMGYNPYWNTCTAPDIDSDGDGTSDCNDECKDDPLKTKSGICGCGEAEIDTDKDGKFDCIDDCPNDPNKIGSGICGCGIADTDSDGDGIPDCSDACNNLIDSDGDGINDCDDRCANDPEKAEPDICGCGVSDVDTDSDGTLDCNDNCLNDPNKTGPGVCGCGIADTDSDGDGTLDCLETDDDNDGLPEEEEQGPNGDDPNYDGNDDGIADSLQDNVASFHAYGDQSYITMESPVGTSISNCKAADNPSPTNSPSSIEFPYGFFEFKITGVGNGDVTTVTLHFPVGATLDTYYKYGPTPDNDIDHWYAFLKDGQTGAEINDNVITLHFVDGERGDDDLTADGIVIDIGGPAVSLDPGGGDGTSDGGSGGGGGCFMGTAANSLE